MSTVLFIAGYALALPLASRLTTIVNGQKRLAFAGHQFGVGVALLGWLVRGSYVMALLHAVWIVVARLWFGTVERKRRTMKAGATAGQR